MFNIIFISVAESGSSILSVDFSVFLPYDTPLEADLLLIEAFEFLLNLPWDIMSIPLDDLTPFPFALIKALVLMLRTSSLVNLAVGTSNDLN